jgi:hypothetical protein
VTQAIQYADIDPNSENTMPNYNKSLDILGQVPDALDEHAGLNMDTEFTNLKQELQTTWDSASDRRHRSPPRAGRRRLTRRP